MATHVYAASHPIRSVTRSIIDGRIVIKIGNSTAFTISDAELDEINKRVASLGADVAVSVPDYPDDVPASLVEAQAVDG